MTRRIHLLMSDLNITRCGHVLIGKDIVPGVRALSSAFRNNVSVSEHATLVTCLKCLDKMRTPA